MELEYSNDKKSQDRIKKLKKLKLTYKLIELFIFLTAFNFSLAREFDLITIIVFALVIAGSAGMLEFICNTFVVNNIKEILIHELNPKLFIDCNIYWYNLNKKNKTLCNYTLCDIATGYLYDGNFDKCEEIIAYLEEQKLDLILQIVILQQKMDIYYFKRKYKKALEIKSQLLTKLDSCNLKIKDQILAEVETKTALIEENKDKLSIILKNLRRSKINLDKVDYLYIKSQFFEEEDNKYQKKLAFEGGDIFYAREELEDQSISTKNNMKPIKHKGFHLISNFILVVSIITTILSFIAYFL